MKILTQDFYLNLRHKNVDLLRGWEVIGSLLCSRGVNSNMSVKFMKTFILRNIFSEYILLLPDALAREVVNFVIMVEIAFLSAYYYETKI